MNNPDYKTTNETAQQLEAAFTKYMASVEHQYERNGYNIGLPEKEQVLNNSHFMFAKNNVLAGPLIQAIYSENQEKFDAYITIISAGNRLSYNELWRDHSGCEGTVDTTNVSEIKAYFFDGYVIQALDEPVYGEIMISPQAKSLFIPFCPFMSLVDYIAINIGIALYYN